MSTRNRIYPSSPLSDSMSATAKPHTRSSSFFSFSSRKSAQQQARTPPMSPSLIDHGHPSSSSTLMQSQVPSISSHVKRPSLDTGLPSPNPAVQREIKSVVDLALAHAQKVYFSGPLVRRTERQPDGTRPARDDGWVEIWAQLGGTTLSVWDKKAIEEASKRGEEVPPSYINVTDSFIQVLGALTSPATATTPATRYTNVIALNTAGSNLILLACPSSQALISWSSSLRLASWEKSRLEEIYTGHLLRMSLSEGEPWKEPASTLSKGKLEGQVKVRFAGHTDWKPLWMVVSSTGDLADGGSTTITRRPTLERTTSPNSTARSRNRFSSIFSRSSDPPSSSQSPGTNLPTISLYASGKGKDLKRPLLTMRYVSQAFAVYPERVEVISRSTLLKIEGLLGEEDMAGPMRGKQAWLMIMPETTQAQPVFELLKWLVAVHDAFSLYGRPSGYVWDPRQPASMWFAYPVGAQRAHLLLEREAAETLDPRDDRTSIIRKNLKQIVTRRMYGSSSSPGRGSLAINQPIDPAQRSGAAPTLPPIQPMAAEGSGTSPQLPPLTFNGPTPQQVTGGSGQTSGHGQGAHRMPPIAVGASTLSPITESSPAEPRAPPSSSQLYTGEPSTVTGPPHPPQQNGSSVPITPGTKTGSEDQYAGSRPDSKLAQSNDSTGNGQPNGTLAAGQSPPIEQGAPENRSINQATHTSSGFTSPAAAPPPLAQSAPSSSRPESRTQSPTIRSVQSPSDATSASASKEHPGHIPAPSHNQSTLSASQYSLASKPQMAPSPPPKIDTSSAAAIMGRKSPPARPSVSSSHEREPSHDLASEPGALYLLQQQAEQEQAKAPPQPGTWSTSEGEDEQESDPSGPERNPPPRRGGTSPTLMQAGSLNVSESKSGSHALLNLGRKPSGARAQPGLRRHQENSVSLEAIVEPPADLSSAMEPAQDDTADALAALTFLEQEEQQPPKPPPPAPQPPVPHIVPSPPPSESHHYPSSFAPSKQAAERKAKAQAQQEATYAATHLPGKPNGKNRKKNTGAWAESSDEEEEEDEDEEEEDGSEGEAPTRVRQPLPAPAPDPRVSVYPSAQPDSQGGPPMAGDHAQARPRTLPLPPTRTGGSPHDAQSAYNRVPPGQYDDRPRTHLGDEPKGHTITSHQAARQSVWSTVLNPQPPPRNTSGQSGTFVQVDEPESMTKAFQPQGLLSAGLQDKEDRSAKRQEELARETGASLINVPNKPPPPQTGLLGAITAHERERKREGGVGATLTEKERERRLAEERQRKLDELQRQQIDQLSQAGGQGAGYDPYGQPQFPGFGQPFDPRMSMNPMMLNPYMAGGFPMMPFGNPQQMMAAQLAAQQAYQQAMMSFSQAGASQTGDNISPAGAPASGNPPSPIISPMMNASPSQMQAGMMGMDPRLSMMAPMGMMMANGMGMNPMMGMGMGMGQNFDPRASMAQFNYLQRPDSGQGGVAPGAPGLMQPSPGLRQGSPVPPHSGNNSPRPQNT